MDSYRVEKQAVQRLMLPDEDAEIEPTAPGGGGHLADPELKRLSTDAVFDLACARTEGA